MTTVNIDYYASLRATPEVVGRKELLDQIHQAINDGSDTTYIFHITANGGWGKTRLLEEVLKRLKNGNIWATQNVLPAKRLVDLYHTYTHSEEGLISDIVDAFDHKNNYFQEYFRLHGELNRIKSAWADDFLEMSTQRSGMVDAFLKDFNKLGDDFHRIVLCIDTIEDLFYEPERIQDALMLTEEPLGVADWLVKRFLPNIRKCVVLIAGRVETNQSTSRQIADELRKIPSVNFVPCDLKPFTEAQTLEYFKAIADVARKDNPNPLIAEKIEGIPEETQRVMHYLSGGRPFFLSIFIDYLAVTGGTLPTITLKPLEVVKQLNQKLLQELQTELETAIIRGFEEAPRPLDHIIRAASWTVRGMDAELLAWLVQHGKPSQTDINQVKQGLELLRKPNPNPDSDLRLSFVKIRPTIDSEMIFLQDEMYKLLQSRHREERTMPTREKTLKLILAYYNQKIKQVTDLISKMQQSRLERVTSASMKEFIRHRRKGFNISNSSEEQDDLPKYRAIRQTLQVDRIYYMLQLDELKGLQAYFEVAEEAFQSNDLALWLLLRNELLRFAKQYNTENPDREILDIIESDIGVRWIKINIGIGNYEKASKQAISLREKCSDLLTPSSFADLNLKICEGWLQVYGGKDAEQFLREVLAQIQNLSQETEFDKGRKEILEASAQNVIGYDYYSKGKFAQASKYYRKNLPIWRRLKLSFEATTTLNNLAWAEAEEGDFEGAIHHCEDALKLRYGFGHRYPIARSLTTLGSIETRNGQPERAYFHCRQALSVFQELGQPRGIGLACIALAESLRRMTNVPYLLPNDKVLENLRDAYEYAQKAVDIFNASVTEPLRLIEAYIELGCICRELARHLLKSKKHKERKESQEMIIKSIDALRKAAGKTDQAHIYRAVDAFVNLAWLYYYINDHQKALDILENEAFPKIDSHYQLSTEHKPLDIKDEVSWLWVELGKGHLLLGKIAFDHYLKVNAKEKKDMAKIQECLQEAAHYWTLSVAYNWRYGENFRDFLAGRNEIINCLVTLNNNELNWVLESIQNTYQKYHISEESSLFEELLEKRGLVSERSQKDRKTRDKI